MNGVVMQRFAELQALLRKAFPDTPAWIAGGAIRDVLTHEPVNDVDVFFAHGVDARAEAERLVGKGDFDFDVFETPHAYKLADPYMGFKLDLVKLTAADPSETIAHFDFTMCAAALDRDGRTWQHPDFLPAVQEKRLSVLHMTSPMNTLRRVQKYVARGYTLSFPELVTIMDALRAMPAFDYDAQVGRLKACSGNPS